MKSDSSRLAVPDIEQTEMDFNIYLTRNIYWEKSSMKILSVLAMACVALAGILWSEVSHCCSCQSRFNAPTHYASLVQPTGIDAETIEKLGLNKIQLSALASGQVYLTTESK